MNSTAAVGTALSHVLNRNQSAHTSPTRTRLEHAGRKPVRVYQYTSTAAPPPPPPPPPRHATIDSVHGGQVIRSGTCHS